MLTRTDADPDTPHGVAVAALTPRRPQSADDWDAYAHLRWTQLRQPWGQPPDALDSAEEAASEHLIIRAPDTAAVIACGRLVAVAPGIAQIRSMAVAAAWQGQGLGRRILDGLEALARGRGVETLRAHARSSALGFYQRAGFVDAGPGERLFGQIPHRWLRKPLDCHDFSRFGLTLRPAAQADGARVQSLVFDVLGDYGLAPELDGIDRDMQDLVGVYREGFFHLLENADGALQGTVAIRRLAAERGELRRMYLARTQRGRGLGRACLGHALAWARAAGIRELELETATVLREARALYRWAGFAPTPAADLEARRCDLKLVLRDF